MAEDMKVATISFITALLLIAGLELLPLSGAAYSDEAAETPAPPCAKQLLSMSSCLQATMAAPPSEVTPAPKPTTDCCMAFYSSLDSSKGGVPCLCQLIRKPELMQVHLNASSVADLFSSCGSDDLTAATSFTSGCKEASSPRETDQPDDLPSFSDTVDNSNNSIGNYSSQVLEASSGNTISSCYGWLTNSLGTLYQIIVDRLFCRRQPAEPFQNQYIPFPKHPNDL